MGDPSIYFHLENNFSLKKINHELFNQIGCVGSA